MPEANRLTRWLGSLLPGRPLKALFIGNSFTYYERPSPEGPAVLADLPALLSRLALCRRERRPLKTGRLCADGASLEDHWEGGRWEKEFLPGTWDLVVLQENSDRALSGHAALRRDARRWSARIRACGARPAIFAAWAPGDRRDCAARLDRVYAELAAELDALHVPVARAWEIASARRPGLELRMPDGLHPSPLGGYLAACVFYAAFYGRSPQPAAEDADAVKELACAHARLAGEERPDVSGESLEFLRWAAWEAVSGKERGVQPAITGHDDRPAE